jgi:ornithine carbamoyltransferase
MPSILAGPRHLIDLWRLDKATLRAILDDAHRRKAARKGWRLGRADADAPATDATLAMVFELNSTRTRFSFDAAMRQLGGSSIIATAADMQLGRGETVEDTARVLSRMVDLIMIRAHRHEDVERFAQASQVPVINGLTDKSHPCQILADLQTIEEVQGSLEGRKIAWVGDGNNVCTTYIQAAAKFGYELTIACPTVYHPDLMELQRAQAAGGKVRMIDNANEAVDGADVVVTDTWVSMGDVDLNERLDAFEAYQVDEALMEKASPNAIFLHCLPAHRSEEVTDEVIDGPQSEVWAAAENRIHAQKAVIAWCLGAVG